MISNVLLTERGNRWMTKLDDSTSMASIAIRDGIDSSGRTVMEYKRSRYGGRERLFEEFSALVIWGFGVNIMKRLYDQVVRRFTPVKYPEFDISMLKDGPQKLTPELLEKFNTHEHFKGAYSELLKVVNNEGGLRKLQSASTFAKLLFATGIPVALIAFGIPTFNQWWTRKELEHAKNKQSVTNSVSPVQPAIPAIQLPNVFSSTFQTAQPAGRFVSQSPSTPVNQLFSQPYLQGNTVPVQSANSYFKQNPQFSGLGGLAASLLQNERYNTLLVDGVISGGRTYKARNKIERLEIAFREALIVFFLYFSQAPIQKFFSNLFDRMPGTHTQLPFDTLKHLHQEYGAKSSHFVADYEKSMQGLTELLGISEKELFQNTQDLEAIQNFRWLKRIFNPEKVARLEKLEADLETKLVESVHNYFLNDQTGNLFLETAKSCGWVPTFVKNGEKNGVQMLDFRQKIQTQPILRMAEAFGKIHQDLTALMPKSTSAEAEKLMGKILKKSMSGRFGALVFANAICFVGLSILGPRVQHLITRRTTGQDYFPGVQANQDQRTAFNLKHTKGWNL